MPIALIDSNNFYAACEQSKDPSIMKRPLVILSNNDGCIIARNAEAKVLGISMGQPYFKIHHKLKLDNNIQLHYLNLHQHSSEILQML